MAVDEEVLSFGIDVNVREAQKRLKSFEDGIKRHFQSVTRASKKMADGSSDALDDLTDANEKLLDSISDLDDAKRASEKLEKHIQQLDMKRLSSIDPKERKSLAAQIKSHKQLNDQLKKAKKTKKSEFAQALADPKLAKAMGRQLKGEFKDAFVSGINSIQGKDLKGLTRSLGDMIGKGAKMGGLKVGRLGAGMEQKGAAMKAGGAGKMGGAMAGMGKVLGALAKAAPLISTLASVLVKIVTLFIDVESQAKAFNKEILESASTIEFFNRGTKDAKLDALDLEGALRTVRDTAHDAMFNLEWGATADTHKAVLNVLNQEGVSLKAISDEAAKTGVSLSHMQKQLVSTSIVYSRSFGLPLQEINQMQAEMFTEMGMSVQETQSSFAHMSRAADEAGISANKFFGMIRGVSQDLSLWGTRMEDAVKLLGRLGKVMNPREAQKFMATATQGLKQMGRTDRLRLTLLAGEGKMGKLIEKDIKRKGAGLAKTLGMEADVLMTKMKKEGPKGLEAAIQKLPKEQQGAARGAAIEMKEQMVSAGKGVFGKAIAARTLGPGAALEAMKAGISRMGGGGKSLMEMRGNIGAEMMAENLGVSEEQLSQMVKFEQSMDMYREELKLRLAENQKKADAGDKEAIAELERLKKAGVQTAKDIDAKGYDELMDTMTDAEKANAEDQGKIRDFAREQTDMQTSMVDKLGILVDFAMNELYGILVDILSVLPGASEEAKRAKMMKIALASGNADLVKAVRAGGGRGELLGTSSGKELGHLLTTASSQLSDYDKKIAELDKKAQTGNTPEDRAAAAEELKKVSQERDALQERSRKARSGVERHIKKQDSGGMFKVREILEKEKIGDLKPEKMAQLQMAVGKGENISQALKDAGLSEEDISKFFAKSLWYLDEQQVAGLIGENAPVAPGGTPAAPGAAKPAAVPGAPAPAAPGVPTAVPSAQEQASAKAAGESPVSGAPAPAGAGAAAPEQMAAVKAINENIVALRLPTTDDTDRTIEAIKQTTAAVQTNTDVLGRKVKLDKSFVTGELGKQIESSVLDAVRVALIEYKLYKDIEMKDFTDQLKQPDFDAKTFGKELLEQGKEGKLPTWATSATTEKGDKTQTGGLILGQNPDGSAKILRPPAGEMPAFVGAGETVVPRGGAAGSGVNLTVNVAGVGGRDLARAVEVAATNAIYEYKRREGLH